MVRRDGSRDVADGELGRNEGRVRLTLTILLGIQATFLIWLALAVHAFFSSPEDGATTMMAVPSPRVTLVFLAGLVLAGGAIASWLRLRESTVQRTPSTVSLVLSAAVNLALFAFAVSVGLWFGAAGAGLVLALLRAEWRASRRTLAGDLRGPGGR